MTMTQKLEIQELVIVITANNYDPSLLNPDFLRYSSIVPADWTLAKQPVVSNRVSEIIFSNGVQLAASPNRLMFIESLSGKEAEEIIVSEIAKKYINVLHDIEYERAGINFRGYTHCPQQTIESNRYILDNFIAPGEWQNCGCKSINASLNLVFNYEAKKLSLDIVEAGLKLPEAEQVPVILFSGNFDYDLSAEVNTQRVEKLEQVLNNWQDDLTIYTDVINKLVEGKRGINLFSDSEQKVPVTA